MKKTPEPTAGSSPTDASGDDEKQDDSDMILRHLSRLFPVDFARAIEPQAKVIRVYQCLDTPVASNEDLIMSLSQLP